jgi:hypothetical protein
MNKKKTGTFTSLDGKKHTITGFTRMMAVRVEEAVKTSWELEEKRALPERPTYKVSGDDSFGGEDIVYYHTKETLETEEEIQAWEEYERTQNELNSRIWRQMIHESMDCVQVPLENLKEYVIEQRKKTGLRLPNPEEYESRVKRIYVEHIVLCDSTEEMMRLLTETMKVAGVISDEEAGNALESFRNQKEEQSGESAKRQDSSESAGNS